MLALLEELPPGGTALDLAGGSGRHALWLARRGWAVTLADISPVALERAAAIAAAAGIALSTLQLDLEEEPLPAGPWDLVVIHAFLMRPVVRAVHDVLAAGGHLAMVHPTQSNLLRHPHPSARFLLRDGELPGLLDGLVIVRSAEGWCSDGRHLARALARRPERAPQRCA